MKNSFIYDKVNELIFAQLEKGNIPWRKPWSTSFPINYISKQEYNGFNWWLLMMTQELKHYKINYWATFNQISQSKGKVKKGEKATMITYWKILEVGTKENKKTGKLEAETVPLLRYYYVFNLDQTDIKLKPKEVKGQINLEAQNIIDKYQTIVPIKEGGNRAYYSPQDDFIQIPLKSQFSSIDEFYATNFHEITHSTGHPKRLNRFESENYSHTFGSPDYSKEELIAEMGSSYLCAKTGILPNVVKNAGAYIKCWLSALKNDKTLLVSASGKAQKAVEFVLTPIDIPVKVENLKIRHSRREFMPISPNL